MADVRCWTATGTRFESDYLELLDELIDSRINPRRCCRIAKVGWEFPLQRPGWMTTSTWHISTLLLVWLVNIYGRASPNSQLWPHLSLNSLSSRRNVTSRMTKWWLTYGRDFEHLDLFLRSSGQRQNNCFRYQYCSRCEWRNVWCWYTYIYIYPLSLLTRSANTLTWYNSALLEWRRQFLARG